MGFNRSGFYAFFVLSLLLFSCNRQEKLFARLPASKTNIDFVNRLPEREGFNILYYLYYYNGGGVATGDINNDGLPDIYFTANTPGNNKLYLNKGNMEFEDITASAGVSGTAGWCSGVTMADVNGDGLLDIYVSAIANKFGLQGHNQLFINQGNAKFREESAAYGLNIASYSAQAVFFDYDRDGDLDCFILNQSDRPFQNIVDTSHRRKIDPNAGDRLLRNDMNTAARRFTDVSTEAGIYQSNLGYGLGLAVADLNNDGWDDIYIGNDFHENDYYYINNGDGSFTESGEKHFNHYSRFSMGNDIADYNNDGQLDIVTTDMLPPDERVLKTYGSDENPDIYRFKITRNGFQQQVSRNSLQMNNGSGSSFSETGLISGISATDWSWSALFADIDNDGNKDLFMTSGIVKRTTDLDYIRFVSDVYNRKRNPGQNVDDEVIGKMPGGASHSYVFRGDGKLLFTDQSEFWGTAAQKGFFTGAAYADLDNDGDLDFVVNSLNATSFIYENKTTGKNYLTVKLQGDGLNSSGIGAKVYLFSGGKMLYQQLMITRGFQSACDPRLHFGLDSLQADSLLVVWPDQRYQRLAKPGSNKLILLEQKNAAGQFEHESFFPQAPAFLKPVDVKTVDWKHEEDDFDDFNVQYLLPHGLSARGPRIAVADVNGDGLEDFYTCGAKNQPGVLFRQHSPGVFVRTDTALFHADRVFEDVDAVFFDANGDGFPDLYVVSGGNQQIHGSALLADRLYLNDGKGRFSKALNSLPPILTNKSTVAVADVDGDGDLDIFLGTLADPKAYGKAQHSYLLLNNGQAVFSRAPDSMIKLSDLGLVTSSCFADLDDNGSPDLIVSGEWMPITVFLNNKGSFSRRDVPASTGIWQTIRATDVNGDGYPDILAGNWGKNNKFYSGKISPLKLYHGDFDGNGSSEQLVSYNTSTGEYPFLAKDEVERALPLLKKHYLSYSEYAGVQMKDVFYGWIDQVKPLIAERLASAVLYGDGKGNFSIRDLPDPLQLAPLFVFQELALGSKKADGPSNNPATAATNQAVETSLFLCGGNFFEVIPYEGRYDALPLALFSAGVNNGIRYRKEPNLLSVKGQVRDIKWIDMKEKGKMLIVARNDAALLFYQINN